MVTRFESRYHQRTISALRLLQVASLRESLVSAFVAARSRQDGSTGYISALDQQATALSALVGAPSQLGATSEVAALEVANAIALDGATATAAAGAPLAASISIALVSSLSSLLDGALLTRSRNDTNSTGGDNSGSVPLSMETSQTTAPSPAPTSLLHRRRQLQTATSTSRPTISMSNGSDDTRVLELLDAVEAISAAQLSGAVAGEAATTTVTTNLLVSSSRRRASDAERTVVVGVQADGGGVAPSVTLGAAAASSPSLTELSDVDTSLLQWGYNIYTVSALKLNSTTLTQ